MNGITENFSEKRKRGRPGVPIGMPRDWFPDITTQRGMLNIHYWSEACDVLRSDEGRFVWLFTPRETHKRTILAELGRFWAATQDKELVFSAAARLCEEKPRTVDAVAWLRRIRLGRPAPVADSSELARKLASLVDSYTRQHPGTTPEHIRAALETVIEAVPDSRQSEAA